MAGGSRAGGWGRMGSQWAPYWLWACLCVVWLASPADAAAIMAVDYGSEWIKVALVKPGMPMDIVLDRDSRRKTQAAVAVRGSERTFGTDAYNLAMRFPGQSFPALKSLLGVGATSEEVDYWKNLFPAPEVIPHTSQVQGESRNGVAFRYSAGANESTVEELVAMQFAYARDMVDDRLASTGEKIRDVIVTVPPFWGQHERNAIAQAAEMAGLRVIGLVNDQTAVALNYALVRTSSFEVEPKHTLFYDMGAASTKATLISFYNKVEPIAPKSRRNKTLSVIEARSVGWDSTLGGHEIDRRLRDHLAASFQKQKGSKLSQAVTANGRAMAKLMREAGRVKMVLSANAEAYASIESLLEDQDFRLKVTRVELESLCDDLKPRITKPIGDALAAAGLTANDVQNLVLHGGSTRVPMVQSALKDLMGDAKLTPNVNADEASVMGAAYYGAGLSPQFKVKDLKVKEVHPYPIEISYMTEGKSGKDSRPVKSVLFKPFSSIPNRKIVTFKHKNDFQFELNYLDNDGTHSGSKAIFRASISGLANVTAKLDATSLTTLQSKVSIGITDSGLITLYEPHATWETDPSSVMGKLSGFFGGKKDQNETGEGNSTKEAVDSGKKVHSAPLAFAIDQIGVPAIPAPERAAIARKLNQLDGMDRRKRNREEARNTLEAAIYRVRDTLNDREIQEISTKEQRKELEDEAAQGREILDADGQSDAAETSDFQLRLRTIRNLEGILIHRLKNRKNMPLALEQLDRIVTKTKMLLVDAKQNTTDELETEPESRTLYTLDELDQFIQDLENDMDWKEKQKAAFDKQARHEEPVLLVEDIEKKIQDIEARVKALTARKRPLKKKKLETPLPSASLDEMDAESLRDSDARPTGSEEPIEKVQLPPIPETPAGSSGDRVSEPEAEAQASADPSQTDAEDDDSAPPPPQPQQNVKDEL